MIELEHTGTILREEFLEPLELSAYRVAKETGIAKQALSEIIAGKRSITAETSLPLDKYFGLSEGFFFRLQRDYDLRLARRKLEGKLKTITPLPRMGLEEQPVA